MIARNTVYVYRFFFNCTAATGTYTSGPILALHDALPIYALQADLEQAIPLVWGRQVVSIFIGGGTPSLLSGEAIERMLALFRACLNIDRKSTRLNSSH